MSLFLDVTSGIDKPSFLARRSTQASPGAAAAGSRPGSAERSRQLRDLRLSIWRLLTAGVPGQPCVGLYVLVEDDSSAGERRAVALARAGQAGFEVAETYVDDTWRSDPVSRFALTRAYAALRRRDIHGLVVVSQVDISPIDSVYEKELHRLWAAGGFLDLAHDESRI